MRKAYRGHQVQADQFDGSEESAKEIIDWIVSLDGVAALVPGDDPHIIFGHRGMGYIAHRGWWVVLDPSYYLTAVDDDEFRMTYEEDV